MITLRPANERGHFNHGWLDTYHTFSFADYYDPNQMGFRTLRVINEDTVQPGQGFSTHGHRDMEIISYVLEGALEHKDSMGGGGVLRPGDVQRMSAGTGVLHSEFNHSKEEPVKFLQIWIRPRRKDIPPRYDDRTFPIKEKRGELVLIASPDGREYSLNIEQDVKVYASVVDHGQRTTYNLEHNRYGWIQVARGRLRLNDQVLQRGDGASISNESRLELEGLEETELLFFDLA
jgi:redox-sensitive bicupin YhaK (pirin superfamily)